MEALNLELQNIGEEDSKKILAIFLLTDGNVRWSKSKKAFLIRFWNKDRSLHHLFKEFFKIAFRENITNKELIDGRVLVTSLKRSQNSRVIKSLFSLSPTFKTKPGNVTKNEFLKLPQPTISFLFDSSIEVQTTAFRIAMACEGSVGISFNKNFKPKPRLRLACVHPKLAEEWKKISKTIGLKMNLEKDRNTWSGIHGLITNSVSELIKFRELGGFLPQDVLVCRGRFKGWKKNLVLDIACDKNKISNYFKRIADPVYSKKFKTNQITTLLKGTSSSYGN